MIFDYTQDNERLTKRLNDITSSGRISHAYLLEGDSWLDKKKFAEAFAKGIMCPRGLGENCGRCNMCDKIDHGNCEDLIYVEPEKTGNVINEKVESMQEQIKTKPFGTRHVVIMQNADTMTKQAQNRLLKTLEEPPGDSVIILLSENMENLEQTIRSRCVKFRINHFGSENYDFMMDTARELVDMALKRATFFAMHQKVEGFARDKEKVKALLDSMEVVYRDMLVNSAGKVTNIRTEDVVNNIHLVELASEDIRIGVSPATAIKNLIIKIGG